MEVVYESDRAVLLVVPGRSRANAAGAIRFFTDSGAAFGGASTAPRDRAVQHLEPAYPTRSRTRQDAAVGRNAGFRPVGVRAPRTGQTTERPNPDCRAHQDLRDRTKPGHRSHEAATDGPRT